MKSKSKPKRRTRSKSSHHTYVFQFFVLLFLLAALPLTFILVQQQQTLQQHAATYGACTGNQGQGTCADSCTNGVMYSSAKGNTANACGRATVGKTGTVYCCAPQGGTTSCTIAKTYIECTNGGSYCARFCGLGKAVNVTQYNNCPSKPYGCSCNGTNCPTPTPKSPTNCQSKYTCVSVNQCNTLPKGVTAIRCGTASGMICCPPKTTPTPVFGCKNNYSCVQANSCSTLPKGVTALHCGTAPGLICCPPATKTSTAAEGKLCGGSGFGHCTADGNICSNKYPGTSSIYKDSGACLTQNNNLPGEQCCYPYNKIPTPTPVKTSTAAEGKLCGGSGKGHCTADNNSCSTKYPGTTSIYKDTSACLTQNNNLPGEQCCYPSTQTSTAAEGKLCGGSGLGHCTADTNTCSTKYPGTTSIYKDTSACLTQNNYLKGEQCCYPNSTGGSNPCAGTTKTFGNGYYCGNNGGAKGTTGWLYSCQNNTTVSSKNCGSAGCAAVTGGSHCNGSGGGGSPYCGDGTCNNGETCSSCSKDCGQCTGGGGGGNGAACSATVNGITEYGLCGTCGGSQQANCQAGLACCSVQCSSAYASSYCASSCSNNFQPVGGSCYSGSTCCALGHYCLATAGQSCVTNGTCGGFPSSDICSNGLICCANPNKQAGVSVALFGGNSNPQKQSVQATLSLANQQTSSALLSARVLAAQVYTVTATLTFDPASHTFTNNNITLGTIPNGSYNMIIHVDGHLDKQLTTDTGSSTFIISGLTTLKTSPAVLQPGDVAPVPHTDNFVDIQDYNQVVSCYGQSASSCSNKLADLNSDGVIDDKDLQLLQNSFGLLGDSFSPPQFECVTDPSCSSSGKTIQLCPLKCTKK